MDIISYALARQLKYEGFPQPSHRRERPGSWYYPDGTLGDWWDGEESVYIPLLSELIKWCGDGFYSLHRTTSGYAAAGGNDKCKCDRDECSGWQHFDKFGSLPEEAVALLGMELNKK